MGSKKLHLGCGRTILEGWVNLDSKALPGVDMVLDLDSIPGTHLPGSLHIPVDANSIEEVLANHLLEHIAHPLPLMQELWRVCAPGAKMTVRVPYGSSDDAFEDPGHVRQYFLQSFGYFSQPFYWRADYNYRGDWKTERIILRVEHGRYRGIADEQVYRDVMNLRNVVVEMQAELYAVKPARPPKAELRDKIDLRFERVAVQ